MAAIKANGPVQQVLINLHNHSTWSDGVYTPQQLVEAGATKGLTHIGISDHFCTEKLGAPQFYVQADEIGPYAADLRRVAELYGEQIQMLAGIEVDWSPRTGGQLDALWSGIDRLDYVLFEYVQDDDWHGDSLQALIDVRPRIPIPVGLAHNDLSRNFRSSYSPQGLVALFQEHHIFVELSTSPRTRNYDLTDPYSAELWAVLAGSEVLFSVGADTHGRLDDVANLVGAHRFLETRNLLARLITSRWDPATQGWNL
jgi:histidinol phosphatase-like PHP family hydrolase